MEIKDLLDEIENLCGTAVMVKSGITGEWRKQGLTYLLLSDYFREKSKANFNNHYLEIVKENK